MKKLAVALSLCLIMLVPVSVAAEDVLSPVCVDNPTATLCEDNTDQDIDSNSIYGPNGLLTKVASIIAVVVGVASVVMIIIGGIQYAISGGDSTRVNKAKDTILYAIIGLVIALAARAIIVFVLNKL